ncbi:hypothetical protein SAMN04515647_2570 [Cohaesibacter sp. ES.047]|nr:hypothetical protein SAMN04515647_2570 [Cohaesibacter sp. ES.047]
MFSRLKTACQHHSSHISERLENCDNAYTVKIGIFHFLKFETILPSARLCLAVQNQIKT